MVSRSLSAVTLLVRQQEGNPAYKTSQRLSSGVPAQPGVIPGQKASSTKTRLCLFSALMLLTGRYPQ